MPLSIMRRYAVEWYTPGTMTGDGRPLHGTAFVTAFGPHAAWDTFESSEPELNRVVVRVGEPHALLALPRLRDIIDREEYRVTGPERHPWRVEGGHMQEDGLHGIDGYRLVRGDGAEREIADDSFTTDHDTAADHARELNDEDRHA